VVGGAYLMLVALRRIGGGAWRPGAAAATSPATAHTP
jgi:hypothetical protein